MNTILSLLVSLIIIGVILYIVSLIPMDATIKKIISILAILMVCLWLISMLFGYGTFPRLHLS